MRPPAHPRPLASWALLALWLAFSLPWRPLTLPDEGRYAGVAYEMVASGHDWLTPTLFGMPYFHKPPLMYWIGAAAMELFGAHGWLARSAAWLGALVMAAALAWHARREDGIAAARTTLLVLATMPFFFFAAQFANHDMLVAGWITLAVVAARAALASAGRAYLVALVAAWAAAALGLLSKGLIGLVLPALVLLPWLLVQRRWRDLLRLVHPLGPAVFLLLAAPWLVAMQLRHAGFFDYFVGPAIRPGAA